MKRKRARSAPKGETGGRRRWLVAGVVLASLGAVSVAVVLYSRQSRLAPGAGEVAPASPSSGPLVAAAEGPPDPRAELPPIPTGPQVLPRPPLVVEAVYEFAARHPEVLRYMPCFCGCERKGHGSNHDCFVARRDADGRVTWDAHGAG